MHRISSSFSLIELLIVLGLVAMLVVFAVPAYQVYTQYSQMMTLVKQAVPAQLAVNDFFAENGTIATVCGASGSADYLTPNSTLVSTIAMKQGKILVSAQNAQFPGRNITVFFIPTVVSTTEPLQWACYVTGTSDNSDITPKTCSNTCPGTSCATFTGC